MNKSEINKLSRITKMIYSNQYYVDIEDALALYCSNPKNKVYVPVFRYDVNDNCKYQIIDREFVFNKGSLKDWLYGHEYNDGVYLFFNTDLKCKKNKETKAFYEMQLYLLLSLIEEKDASFIGFILNSDSDKRIILNKKATLAIVDKARKLNRNIDKECL